MDKNQLPKIYEEFDLGGRIKSLQGKKIKVKKLIKKEDGEYTLKDQTTYLNETNQNPQELDIQSEQTKTFNFQKQTPSTIQQNPSTNLNLQKPQNIPTKNKQMFYSTQKGIQKNPMESIASNFGNFGDFLRESFVEKRQVFTKEEILKNIDKAPEQKNQTSIAFASFNPGMVKKQEKYNINQAGLFRLPKDVDTFLENEEKIKERIKIKMNQERIKSFEIIDQLKKEFETCLDFEKAKISGNFENFYSDFTKNLQSFKQVCLQYKDQNFKKEQSEDFYQLQQINYVDKIQNSLQKTEKSDLLINKNDFEKFLYKKKLSFLAESLEKRIYHIPQFATTNFSQQILNEIKKKIKQSSEKDLQGIQDLMYQVKLSNVKDIELDCIKKEIKQYQIQGGNFGSMYVSDFKSPIDTRKSYIPSSLKSSITNVLVERGIGQMRKSMINTKTSSDMTKSQTTNHLIKYALKKDFEFNFKIFDFGNHFKNKNYNGIFQMENFYLLYGDEFYYQFYPNSGEVRALAFQDKNLMCIEKILTQYSCLRLDAESIFAQNQKIKEFLLIGSFDKKEFSSEIIIANFKDEKLHLYKRIKLPNNSLIRRILPLNDSYSFITVTEDGMIYLCDLSMKIPKLKCDKCFNQKIISCAILEEGQIFAISFEDKTIAIFEVQYKKSDHLQDQNPTAFNIERVRLINNTAAIQQIKSTGRFLFEGVDSKGEFTSVDLGQGNVKDTKMSKIGIIDHQIDRFFLLKNKKVGKSTKQQVLVFMNFFGEVGLYNFENETAHIFRGPVEIENFAKSEQNMLLNFENQQGIEVFLVSKKELVKLIFT